MQKISDLLSGFSVKIGNTISFNTPPGQDSQENLEYNLKREQQLAFLKNNQNRRTSKRSRSHEIKI